LNPELCARNLEPGIVKRLRFDLNDSILHKDDDYVVINKPPFISTLEDRNDQTNILSIVRQTFPDAQVGHRLDKDTSGVLAIALNPESYRQFSMQLEHREVTKIYHAIVEGTPALNEQRVEAPILKQADGRVKISRDGKQAETWFSTVKNFRGYSLVECRPVTGRMHQIRIHLSLLGASIAGDEMYGGKPVYLSTLKRSYNLKKDTVEEPIMKRMALHAFSLEFLGVDGKKLRVEAPYPKDFRVLLRQLEENAK
jgi:RluA family pseudouridine synthase